MESSAIYSRISGNKLRTIWAVADIHFAYQFTSPLNPSFPAQWHCILSHKTQRTVCDRMYFDINMQWTSHLIQIDPYHKQFERSFKPRK